MIGLIATHYYWKCESKTVPIPGDIPQSRNESLSISIPKSEILIPKPISSIPNLDPISIAQFNRAISKTFQSQTIPHSEIQNFNLDPNPEFKISISRLNFGLKI